MTISSASRHSGNANKPTSNGGSLSTVASQTAMADAETPQMKTLPRTVVVAKVTKRKRRPAKPAKRAGGIQKARGCATSASMRTWSFTTRTSFRWRS